jgi:hypothetical protein
LTVFRCRATQHSLFDGRERIAPSALSHARTKPADFAFSTANAGGRTPFLSAQASRSANVWQQQERQHCSDERQPQLLDEHGYCASEFFGRMPTGIEMPAAVARYAINSAVLVERRQTSLTRRALRYEKFMMLRIEWPGQLSV